MRNITTTAALPGLATNIFKEIQLFPTRVFSSVTVVSLKKKKKNLFIVVMHLAARLV